jgi:hypothetical protein
MPINGRLTEAERMKIWPVITHRLGISPNSPKRDAMEDVLIEAYKMFQECGLLNKMEEIVYGIEANMGDIECSHDIEDCFDSINDIDILLTKAKKLINNNII